MVRLLGKENSIVVTVFDDTGATNLSLSYPSDFSGLDVPSDYPFVYPPVAVETAAGQHQRSPIHVEIKLISNNNLWSCPWTQTIAVFNPDGITRLSGGFLRRTFYTATAPDGSNRLYVSATRNGIVSHLPVVKDLPIITGIPWDPANVVLQKFVPPPMPLMTPPP